MAYITLDEYARWYEVGNPFSFERLSLEASRYLDWYTTGIDGEKKLKSHFPTDPEDAQAVMLCAAQLVNFLQEVSDAEAASSLSRGYEKTAQGIRGRVISSMSAGNESISYATGAVSASTAADSAAGNLTVKAQMAGEIVRAGLQGVRDANGVNLLYMGRYPAGV